MKSLKICLKKSVLSLFIVSNFLTLNLSAQGLNNPLIRTCHLNAGSFWVLNNGFDDLPLCFFESAAISAIDLLENQNELKLSQALLAYKNNKSENSFACGMNNGTERSFLDSNMTAWDLCLFQDKSFIEIKTLNKGISHPDNFFLTSVLKF